MGLRKKVHPGEVAAYREGQTREAVMDPTGTIVGMAR